jgi:hypothetical protein
MSNIVKIAKREVVKQRISHYDTSDEAWNELRFTDDERDSWIAVGIVHPCAAYTFRLHRITPDEITSAIQKDYNSAISIPSTAMTFVVDSVRNDRKRKAGTYDPRAVE